MATSVQVSTSGTFFPLQEEKDLIYHKLLHGPFRDDQVPVYCLSARANSRDDFFDSMNLASVMSWYTEQARWPNDIEFLDLPRVVEHALGHVTLQAKPTLDDLIAADADARRVAAEWRA